MILRLHEKVFRSGSIDKATWKWKFDSNPAGRKWIVLTLSSDGALLGHCALLPAAGSIAGREATMTQLVDVMTEPAVRGATLGRRNIYARTITRVIGEYERHTSLWYGFPAPRHLRLGRLLFGYDPVCEVPLFRLNLPTRAGCAKRSLRSRFLVRPVSSFGHGADRLWRKVRSDYPFGIVRNRAYLNWRYVEKPDREYTILVLFNPLGRWKGWAVLSIDSEAARLVDLLLPARIPAGSADLIDAVIGHAAAAGTARVETWIPDSSPSGQLLQSFGFRRIGAHEPICLTVKINDRSTTPEEFARRYYFQMGDSDMY